MDSHEKQGEKNNNSLSPEYKLFGLTPFAADLKKVVDNYGTEIGGLSDDLRFNALSSASEFLTQVREQSSSVDPRDVVQQISTLAEDPEFFAGSDVGRQISERIKELVADGSLLVEAQDLLENMSRGGFRINNRTAISPDGYSQSPQKGRIHNSIQGLFGARQPVTDLGISMPLTDPKKDQIMNTNLWAVADKNKILGIVTALASAGLLYKISISYLSQGIGGENSLWGAWGLNISETALVHMLADERMKGLDTPKEKAAFAGLVALTIGVYTLDFLATLRGQLLVSNFPEDMAGIVLYGSIKALISLFASVYPELGIEYGWRWLKEIFKGDESKSPAQSPARQQTTQAPVSQTRPQQSNFQSQSGPSRRSLNGPPTNSGRP